MKISVLINYYNRRRILERCLWSIYHNMGEVDDFEVIVVDDKSHPKQLAQPIVDRFKDRLPVRCIYRENKIGKNPGMPLNIGAQAATGDLLLLNDPDFLHASPIMSQMAQKFAGGESNFVVSSCYSIPKSKLSVLDATKFSDPQSVRELADRIEKLPQGIRVEGDDGWNCHPTFRPFGLGSIRGILSEDFHRLGGFDEDFFEFFGYEDTDLLRRTQSSGIPLDISEEMLCYHHWHYDPKDHEDNESRRLGYIFNSRIYSEKKDAGGLIVNAGREWGAN